MDKKNIEIQFLRVVAIGLVIMMHAPIGMFSPFSDKYGILFSYMHPAVGVDIFFVISGYLMGRTFLDRTGEISDTPGKIVKTAGFYLRRFWRLFPASFFWITLTLIVGVISGDSTLWLTPLALYKSWVASVLCFRNFEVATSMNHLGYYWSLSLENQFYFLLPLTWFFLKRKWFWKIVALLCVMCIFWRPGGGAAWLFRFDGLLMGLIVYKLTRLDSFRNAVRLLSPESAAGKTVMTALLCLTIPSIPVTIGHSTLSWSLIALFSSILVCQAALNEGLIHIPVFLRNLVYWTGELSYSIYLCHIPVWLILKDIAKRGFDSQVNPFAFFVLGMACIAISSGLTYFWIERPFLAFGRKAGQRSLHGLSPHEDPLSKAA